ncbi:AMP-dependent synthetase [Chromatiales bacterium (ex Bugula neritina AB1)]|nr:AMP-dependent synthetase [Chromatiales bacterium (ex Bugula neritina AB1)]
MTGDFYDKLETRDSMTRNLTLQMELPKQIAHAKANTAAYAEILDQVDPSTITSIEALAALPVTRKSDLIERQSANRPFGGLASAPAGQMKRVYSSPGPIYEPEAEVEDYWRMGRALYAGGLRRGDLVHNTFSYHFTPAGFMFESGAHAIGCGVFAAGIGQTELQLAAIAELQPVAYAGTPSFLKILLQKATEIGSDTSSLKKALVSGEALPPSLRTELQGYGITVRQCYATADVGLIAYESDALDGLIVDENIVLELLTPGTGDPVADGAVGEIVVTSFSKAYPLVRFATGDLSRVLPGESSCGRTGVRIAGWMGRADQTTKVKGMFVHPEQVAEVVKRYPQIVKARLTVTSVDNADVMSLCCETDETGDQELIGKIAATVKDVCKLRGEVELVTVGELPDDGKVIDDVRSYE